MSLVLNVQSYYTTSTGAGYPQCMEAHVTMCEFVTIDCEEPDQPCIFLPLIERHLKKLLDDGILTTGMRVSCCLFEEQCDKNMNDTSEIVTWFDMHVANLHTADSGWW